MRVERLITRKSHVEWRERELQLSKRCKKHRQLSSRSPKLIPYLKHGAGNLTDSLFNALESIVQASAVFADRLSINGFTLPDLLGGLGTVNFYNADLLGEYGAENRNATNGHYILVDVEATNFLGGVQGETFLVSTIIHEISHAYERVHGIDNVPWDTQHGPGNTLENWAHRMAGELLSLAKDAGFESINEFLDAIEEGNCGDS